MASDFRHDDGDYDDDDERIPKGICSVGIPCAHRDNDDDDNGDDDDDDDDNEADVQPLLHRWDGWMIAFTTNYRQLPLS